MFDLTDILFKQRSKPRGDEKFSHVSDLTTCLRAVAYRRRGVVPAPYTPQDLAKFALGHAYEQNTAKTLREAGHDAQEGAECAGFGLDVGHPDIILNGETLIETKTTSAGALYPKSDKEGRAGQPREVSTHHAIQAAAYALALGLPKAKVMVAHYGYEVAEAEHEIEPEQYRAQIEMLAREVVALTGPEMPLPPAEPPPPEVVPFDSCSYCRFTQCFRNPKHVAGFEDDDA
jgi:hypothetical protein